MNKINIQYFMMLFMVATAQSIQLTCSNNNGNPQQIIYASGTNIEDPLNDAMIQDDDYDIDTISVRSHLSSIQSMQEDENDENEEFQLINLLGDGNGSDIQPIEHFPHDSDDDSEYSGIQPINLVGDFDHDDDDSDE